jgi:hypothetical protein
MLTLPWLPGIAILLLLISSSPFAHSAAPRLNTRPFIPPALPLAIRSPYLNIWYPEGERAEAVNADEPKMWPIDAVRVRSFHPRSMP